MVAPHKILIIGGTSGIGSEVATALALKGHYISVTGHNAGRLEHLRVELNKISSRKVNVYNLDLLDLAKSKKIIEAAWKQVSGFDVTIFFPAVMCRKEDSSEEIAQLYNINTISQISLIKAIAGEMIIKGEGQIMVSSSVSADLARSSRYIYASSKTALEFFCEGFRMDINEQGVKLVILKPGVVNTGLASHYKYRFFISSPKSVAIKISNLDRQCNGNVYIPSYWRYIMWLLKILPKFITRNLG